MTSRYVALFTLLLATGCRTPEPPSKPPSKSVLPIDITRGSGEPLRVVVHPDNATSYESVGKRVFYQRVGSRDKGAWPFVAVPGRGKQIWFGPQQEFYIETRDGLIGLSVGLGLLRWCKSFTDASTATTADEAIAAFDAQVTVPALSGVCRRNGMIDSSITAMLTDLRHVFGLWAFTDGPYSSTTPREVKSAIIGVSDGQVQLHLENPASAFVGDVWIDVRTKRVTRAIRDQAQVYPQPSVPEVQWDERAAPPERGVPEAAHVASRNLNHIDRHNLSLSSIASDSITSVRVTWSDSSLFHNDPLFVVAFVRGLLNRPNEVLSNQIHWSQLLGVPNLVAEVQHGKSASGLLLVWRSGTRAWLLVYQDGSGRWWFGSQSISAPP